MRDPYVLNLRPLGNDVLVDDAAKLRDMTDTQASAMTLRARLNPEIRSLLVHLDQRVTVQDLVEYFVSCDKETKWALYKKAIDI